MVIPVEEDEFLFPQNNEDSVNQLRQLAENKQPGPQCSYMVSLKKTVKNCKLYQ